MKRRPPGPTFTLSATLALALGLVSSPASAFHESAVHVEAGAWFPSLDAEARSSSFGIAGNLVTDTDLGPDIRQLPEAGGGAGIPRHDSGSALVLGAGEADR